MPTLESQLTREQISRVINDWKVTPATFAHKISRGLWIPKAHLMHISAEVAKGIARGGARIIVSVPPRHGKSELLSVYTPSWVLEKYPNRNVIMCSYGADLATGFSRRVRDIFHDEQNHELLNTRIRRDTARADLFRTDHNGMMIAAGLGGPITGRGAHILLIDDYIKEIKEALSPSYRDYVWNWFTTVAYTRLEPGGSCVIIATRWHSDDLIGRILTNFPGQWNYIEFPALATEDDILGRVPGEALFPERYPIEELQDKKELLGSIFFEALYQQRPVDETKRIADSSWLRIVGSLPPNTQKFRIARIWDLAATEGGGDYTVGTLLAYDPDTNNCYILNVIRRQLSPGQVEEIVRQTAVQDGLDTEIDIEQEPGSAGKSLVAHYATTVLPEFRVLGVPVVTNKLIRAQPLLAAAEAGKLHLLEGHWNEAFKREFNAFPGEYDDQVDTAAAGYSKLSGKKIFTASWGRKRSDGSTQNSRAMRGASLSMQSPLGASSRVHGATFGRRSKAKTG